jgi:RecB family exonuclease
VQFVDDKDVSSLGGYFELLPGCHVIGTALRTGVPTPGRTFVGTLATGRLTFALPMRAGHQYRIESRDTAMIGPKGRFTTRGYESDLRGNKTREFERAESPKDIEACKEEAARSLAAPQ